MDHLIAIILDAAIKATVLLSLARVASYFLKRRSAATRHVLYTFALSAVLVLPILTSLMPAWNLPGIPQLISDKNQQASTAVTAVSQQPTRSQTAQPAMPKRVQHKAATSPLTVPISPSEIVQPVNVPAAAPVSTNRLSMNWTQLLLIAWSLGAAILAVRFAAGKLRLARFIR